MNNKYKAIILLLVIALFVIFERCYVNEYFSKLNQSNNIEDKVDIHTPNATIKSDEPDVNMPFADKTDNMSLSGKIYAYNTAQSYAPVIENYTSSRKYIPTCNCKDPKKCCIGGKCIDGNYSEYSLNQCNLYENYKKCLNCGNTNKCGTINTNGDVVCAKCRRGQIPKRSCINTPDDSPAGFGCRGKRYTSNNIQPLDPLKYKGNVCRYPSS